MPLRKPFTATLPKGPASKIAGGSSCSGPVMEGVGSAAGAGGGVVGCCAGGVELVSCPCAPGNATDASECAAGTADCPAAGRANNEPTRNVHRHVYTRKCASPRSEEHTSERSSDLGNATDASECAAGTADCPAAGRANNEPTRNVHRHVYTRKCASPFDSGPNGPVKCLESAFRIRNDAQYQNIRSTSGRLFAIASMAAILGAWL